MSYMARLLIQNEDGELLVERKANRGELPAVTVEEGRVGVSLSRAVRSQLGFKVFCQVPPPDHEIFASGELHLLRLQSESDRPKDFQWVSPRRWLNGDERQQDIEHAFHTPSATTGSYAWYSEVKLWLEKQARLLGVSIESTEQWNGRMGGVLLRVETSGPTLWFKTSDAFNEREYKVTQALVARTPDRLPAIVACNDSWRALLLAHIDGSELFESNDLAEWQRAARSVAEMQLSWAGNEEQLIRFGAVNLCPSTMRRSLPRYLKELRQCMERQPSTPPCRLIADEITALGAKLDRVLDEAETLPFACGLANADFSPHNTLLTERGPVFIDWAEACVSMPLIVGEYLCRRMVVESPSRANWMGPIMRAYLQPWSDAYGTNATAQAQSLLSAFAMLASSLFYLNCGSVNGDGRDRHVRSLARRLANELNVTGCSMQA